MKEKNKVPRWNLTSIYSDLKNQDYTQAVENYIKGMNQIDSLLADKDLQEQEFHQWLAKYLELSNKVGALEESLNAFAYTNYSTDTTNTLFLNNLSYLEELSLKTKSQSLSFQQILSTNQQNLSTFYTSFPQFVEYQYILQQEIEDNKHRMTSCEEQLADDLERTGAAAWGRLHEQIISNLTDNDSGKTFNEIRNEAYSPFATTRFKAWKKEKELLKTMEIPIAAALNNLKGSTITLNQKRHWNEAIDRALASSRMNRTTLNALISAIEESLPMWRRYLKLKGKILSITKNTTSITNSGCAFYDLFAPLPNIQLTEPENNQQTIKMDGWSFSEAQNYIIEKFSSFSQDMGDFAQKAFSENWIDAEVRKGKVGGAYCIDFPAQGISRVLSNFTGTFSDVTTLAHELGHAYHHHCIVGTDYALTHYPMTLAETASIFAETIVMKDIISHSNGYAKANLTELHLQDSCQVLVDILCRFYFEQSVFEQRKKGELSAEDFCRLMTEAQEKSYGEGLSEEKHEYMWAVKTHYYSPDLDFYNFPYAFGLLFALGLYSKYQSEGASFSKTYENLLKNTGKFSCEEICKQAGFNIESKEFWLSGIKTFEEELELLENFAANFYKD
ncbi:MAG: peptidase M3 [Spirochaetaceae bacterium]|nr:peptidase M3 [Spirochaetaceae bacterium]